MKHDDILQYHLIKTNRRLTFDILWQREDTLYQGPDDGDYFVFVASNGYQVISRSRMDIQTERLWLLGAQPNERSGSMVFSSNEKRDRAYAEFLRAIDEWCECVRAGKFGPRPASYYLTAQFLGNTQTPAVDPRPMAYKAEKVGESVQLRRLLNCNGDNDDRWMLGEAHPVTDFARLSEPMPAKVAQFMFESGMMLSLSHSTHPESTNS